MVKNKVHWFYDDVYKENYYVLFSDVPDLLLEQSKENGESETLCKPRDGTGGGVWDGDKGQYIWIGYSSSVAKRMGVICHECAHAVHNTFEKRGLYANYVNDESYCYYLEMVVRKVTEFLYQKGGSK